MSTHNSSTNVQPEKRKRVSFSKIAPAMELPNLISVQKESFERFMTDGIHESLKEFSPIVNSADTMELTFGEHFFDDPQHTIAECRAKDLTYQRALLVMATYINKETGEVKDQLVFMGDFPVMTSRGTFIINGTERVVVSQLVRSPGVYFSLETEKVKDVEKSRGARRSKDAAEPAEADHEKNLERVQFIPARGAWLEFQIDKYGRLVMFLDRKPRMSATLLLRALGIAETNDEIIDLLGDN
ncbi:MAG: DNA-directed RNA polymerase subunit beta, partial [Atopobiaceae bacterium]|nr:DNA-directed RNA polymerase subunit beta [Atopobiaceae bacterium]